MAFSKKVALTVDLEEWTVPQDFGSEQVPEDVRLKVACLGLKRILEILKAEEVKATFFVTAYFAQQNAELLRQLLRTGHEIGNHGLGHARKPQRTLKEEIEAIKKSTHIIEESVGIKPCGYREPYLAISEAIITALMQAGYLYDSSIMGTWLPNKSKWITLPSTPFEWKDKIDSKQNLVELPLSVFSKLRIPVGWWLLRKNFGESVPLLAASLLFRLSRPFITNVHTWELAPQPQGYKVPLHIRINCGERSAQQIRSIITGLKRLGGEFVLMKTMARTFRKQTFPA